MRNFRVVVMVLAIVGVSSLASANDFMEAFETYAAGSEMHGQGGWKGWDNAIAWGAPASDLYALSGSTSVEIGGSADLVHEFDISGGIWEFSVMQYIPSGTTGNTYFILMNSYDDGANQDWSVQWNINLGTGVINIDLGSGTANVVYDQWVELKCVIDLDNNTVDEYYNGELISTHEWDDNDHGTIGAIDLFGNGASSIYYDDITIMRLNSAYNPTPADGAIHPQLFVSLGWTAGDYAFSHDVYLGENFDDVKNGTADTFRGNQPLTTTTLFIGLIGYPYPDGLVPGTTYYWRIDEVNDLHPDSPWKGDVWSFMVPSMIAFAPTPADGAEFIDPNADLSWAAGFGARMHYVYIGDNFDDVKSATGGVQQGPTTYEPGTLELEKTYYWRVDESDGVTIQTGDVWSFTTPGAVGNPSPANSATDVQMTATLSWTPGDSAASHEIYFGTDKDAVRNADTASIEYKATRNLGSESYDPPGKLEWLTTYYWRVDEVNNVNPDSPWKGPVWNFTTADFIVVDDIESYNDLDPNDPESKRIFNTWKDGWDNPEINGSQVGYTYLPFFERSIVHGGSQSMPYFYDNNFKYSEASMTLVYPTDWTEKDVNTLTIWFRGDAYNAAESMYVALNGGTAVYNDDPNAALINTWTEWTIDLQAFTGVNLTSVSTIAIGFGDKNNLQAGGSGKMYFDDIRLYRPGISEVSPITITVPNGDFEEIYKPGSDTITADLGGGWTQGVGPDAPMDDGIATYSDDTTGDSVDIPGWIGADPQGWIDAGGTYERDPNFPNRQGSIARQSDTPDGLYYYLSNGGDWGNSAGGLIVSDASLGNVENGTYTLSTLANGDATPVVLELLADGVALTPSSSVDPVLGDEWQEFSRTYDAASLGGQLGESLTIRLGVGRGASGGQSHFDAASLSYVSEPAG